MFFEIFSIVLAIIFAVALATQQQRINDILRTSRTPGPSGVNGKDGQDGIACDDNSNVLGVDDTRRTDLSAKGATNVIIGCSAGAINSSLSNVNYYDNVLIGQGAGSSNSYNADFFGDVYGCVAVGVNAGNSFQSKYAVAIGSEAGKTSQYAYSVAIGREAGKTNQQISTVAIGNLAGQISQQVSAVAIGDIAGNENQQASAVAIGVAAGEKSQQSNAVAIGCTAGNENQQASAVAIGYAAGTNGQQSNAVAIGNNAGNANQSANSICIGSNSSTVSVNVQNCIAIGANASAGGTSPDSVNTIAYFGLGFGSSNSDVVKTSATSSPDTNMLIKIGDFFYRLPLLKVYASFSIVNDLAPLVSNWTGPSDFINQFVANLSAISYVNSSSAPTIPQYTPNTLIKYITGIGSNDIVQSLVYKGGSVTDVSSYTIGPSEPYPFIDIGFNSSESPGIIYGLKRDGSSNFFAYNGTQWLPVEQIQNYITS